MLLVVIIYIMFSVLFFLIKEGVIAVIYCKITKPILASGIRVVSNKINSLAVAILSVFHSNSKTFIFKKKKVTNFMLLDLEYHLDYFPPVHRHVKPSLLQVETLPRPFL